MTELEFAMHMASKEHPASHESLLYAEVLRLREQWADRLELRDQLELARLERDEARDLQEAHAAVCKQWVDKFATDLGHAIGHLANAAETIGVRVEFK